MLQAFATIWPLAVASAISPSITVIVLAMLAADSRGRTRALAFLAGAAAAMLVWVVIVSSFMWTIVLNTTHDAEEYSRFIDLVLGVLLIGVGLFRWFHHPKAKSTHKFDIKSLDRGPLKRQFAFGAFMQGRNATSVLMFCAAQQHIAASPIELWQKAVLTTIVIAITTASIWLVIIIPDRVTERLGQRILPLREWLDKYAKPIEVVAAIGVGLVLVIRSGVALSIAG